MTLAISTIGAPSSADIIAALEAAGICQPTDYNENFLAEFNKMLWLLLNAHSPAGVLGVWPPTATTINVPPAATSTPIMSNQSTATTPTKTIDKTLTYDAAITMKQVDAPTYYVLPTKPLYLMVNIGWAPSPITDLSYPPVDVFGIPADSYKIVDTDGGFNIVIKITGGGGKLRNLVTIRNSWGYSAQFYLQTP